MTHMSKYRKLLAALGGVCAVLGTVLADGNVTTTEALSVASAIAAAAGVYFARNEPSA